MVRLAAMERRPAAPSRRSSMSREACSRIAKRARAWAARASPASVGRTPRGRRSKSGRPRDSSSSWIWRDTAGWLTPSRFAARQTLPSCATTWEQLQMVQIQSIIHSYRIDKNHVLDLWVHWR